MREAGLFLVDGCFDMVVENNDIKPDDGLETAVAISLFSDQRVTDEELVHGHEGKRGWWGDSLSTIDKDKIGSKLWLLERGKRTQTDLNKLIEYAKLSLKWMLEDGIARTVKVTGSFDNNGSTILNVSITKPDEVEARYNVVWDAQEVRRS